MSSSTALAPLVPAVRGACRQAWKALTSISSVRARKALDSHIFRIDGYSAVAAMTPAGSSINSGNFYAVGRKWNLQFYPNGNDTTSSTLISYRRTEIRKEPTVSVKLSLVEDSQAMAAYKVSILSRSGMPVYSAAVEPYLYVGDSSSLVWSKGSGHRDLVSVEELRRSADRVVDEDDCLNVLCEVSVLTLESESVATWYVRQVLGGYRLL